MGGGAGVKWGGGSGGAEVKWGGTGGQIVPVPFNQLLVTSQQ